MTSSPISSVHVIMEPADFRSVTERIHVPMFEPLMLELRHFADCVRENRPSPCAHPAPPYT
jgi:hypothetical protein